MKKTIAKIWLLLVSFMFLNAFFAGISYPKWVLGLWAGSLLWILFVPTGWAINTLAKDYD